MATNIFSAEEPTLGYLYQINYSLLLLIRSAHIENAQISIEQLDDIQLDTPDFTKLYQTKYHLNSVANLTDRSPDFWKTIRVWCENINGGDIELTNSVFSLVTTATASDGTTVGEFKKSVNERDIDSIISNLDAIAAETTNQTNQAGYNAYNSLSTENKKTLISNITLIDASIDIATIKKEIFSELRKTIIDNKVESLYERLSGWYLEKVIRILLGELSNITFKEYQEKCFEIVDMLKIDNLPMDFPEPIEFSEGELAQLKQRVFVRQLDMIGIRDNSMKSAISDYHRAFEQRSRWVREGLINPEEEIAYERKLFDDWKRKFDLVEDEANGKSDTEGSEIGKAFYTTHYVNSYPRIFIKERFEHTYMITGSCHILSDGKKIGWHPLFREKI